jgi:uncharacterized membrane protein
MTRGQRIDLILGAALAVIAILAVLLATHPEFGTSRVESTWAPEGLGGLITLRGLAALALSPATFFGDEEKLAIREAIAAAEKETSGEIRVHLARRTRGEVRDAATATFLALGMQATAARNGVLIYLSVADHRFAIVGDEGIDQVVPENFWKEVKDGMQARFVRGQFAEGIAEAAGMVGEKLRSYFPYQDDDVNELPDEISTD